MEDNRLPSKFFRSGQEPKKRKINEYFLRFWMIDKVIAKALLPDELARVKGSPLGMLLNLPSMYPWGARFTHYLLCKQLVTKKKYELWFLFGGKPWRFSLREFGIVTGLCCGELPKEDYKGKSVGKEDSYWSTLFGDEETVTVPWIIDKLGSGTVTDHKLRIRYACLLLIEGILCPTSHETPIPRESVELVKDVDKFLAYPWGRKSFELTLRSIKSITRAELAHPTVAVSGFVYALQLVALKAIPAINPTRRKILLSVVRKIEKNTEIQVVPFIEGDLPIEEKDLCLSDEKDEKVDNLMELVAKNHAFSDDMWDVQSRVVVPPIPRSPAKKKMKEKTAKRSSVRKVEKPAKVQVTCREAQGTESCTILRTPAKKIKKKTAKRSSVKKAENPEKVQVTYGEAQGTESCQHGANEISPQHASDHNIIASMIESIIATMVDKAVQSKISAVNATNESNYATMVDKAVQGKISEVNATNESIIATMVDKAVQSKISEPNATNESIIATMVEKAVQSKISEVNATQVSVFETRVEELMSEVRSVGVCRHGISIEAENNGDFGHDSQKEKFPDNNKKKRALADDDSTEISNQAKEGDKVSGAIPASSTYDEKGRSQELAFLDRVHAKLNASGYQDFLGCLILFSKKLISQPVLQDLVSRLIGVYPDLMEAFRDFLVQCEKNEVLLSGIVAKKSLSAYSGQSSQSGPSLSSTAMTAPSTIGIPRNSQYTWSLGAPTAKRQKFEGSWLPTKPSAQSGLSPTKPSAQSGLSQAPRTNIPTVIFPSWPLYKEAKRLNLFDANSTIQKRSNGADANGDWFIL